MWATFLFTTILERFYIIFIFHRGRYRLYFPFDSHNKYKFVFHSVPQTEIVGDSDRYVNAGSTVILRCVIRGAIEQPLYIIWYHGAQQILPDNPHGYQMQMIKNAGHISTNSFDAFGLLGDDNFAQESTSSIHDAFLTNAQHTVRN